MTDRYGPEEAQRDLQVRPTTLPPTSAEWWRTVDEQIFRDIYSSGMVVACSLAAWDAINDRAKALGLNTPAPREGEGE